MAASLNSLEAGSVACRDLSAGGSEELPASVVPPGVILLPSLPKAGCPGLPIPQEHEALREMKNELMGWWDGIRRQRITLLGATNRPFDLDEAALRRFTHRQGAEWVCRAGGSALNAS
jgi:SpoVK/Ycf46/Vps4 family AAA+-type ATPase